MSYFTVRLNGIVDHMKSSSGTNWKQFAARIGMPLSTLMSYANERNQPDTSAVGKICEGLEESDAASLIAAHVRDCIPPAWHERLGLGTDRKAFSISGHDHLPATFRHNIEALMQEAASNDHVIGFIEELVALLGLTPNPITPEWQPPAGKFPTQRVPTDPIVRAPQSGPSTPSLNEDRPTKRGAGPRARGTAAGIRKTVRDSKKS